MKYEKGTFVTVPNRQHLKSLPAITQALFFWICNYSDDNGQCFPSRDTLATDMGVTRRTVDNHLKKLVEGGFVTVENRIFEGEKLTNLYQIMILEGSERSSERGTSYPRVENVVPQGSVLGAQGVENVVPQGSVLGAHRSKPILTKPILTKPNTIPKEIDPVVLKAKKDLEKEINRVAELFSALNKDWKTFFLPGAQRSSIKKIIGFAKDDNIEMEKLIHMAKSLHGVEYAPQIFTPTEMVVKYSKLLASTNKKPPNISPKLTAGDNYTKGKFEDFKSKEFKN
jgi:DNA-binding transcriptional ArsR family regulator